MHLISFLGLSAFLANTVIASPTPNGAAVLSCKVDIAPDSFHHNHRQYQVKTAAVDDQALPDGVYQMAVGRLVVTTFDSNPGDQLLLLPQGESKQRFESKFNADTGTYTFQLVSSDLFIMSPFIQPGAPVILGEPMGFRLESDPESEAPFSFFVSPAEYGPPVAIAQSPLKIYPPRVALMPAGLPFTTVTFLPSTRMKGITVT